MSPERPTMSAFRALRSRGSSGPAPSRRGSPPRSCCTEGPPRRCSCRCRARRPSPWRSRRGPWRGRLAALRLLGLDEGHEVRHRLLHDTRADFTTCGRNILPAPKRSPTTFMPSMSGPSITWIGPRELLPRLFGVGNDVSGDAVHERVREALSTPPARHASPPAASLAPDLKLAARSTSRSVASGWRLKITSSTSSRSARVELLVDAELAGVDDTHRQPARIAW